MAPVLGFSTIATSNCQCKQMNLREDFRKTLQQTETLVRRRNKTDQKLKRIKVNASK